MDQIYNLKIFIHVDYSASVEFIEKCIKFDTTKSELLFEVPVSESSDEKFRFYRSPRGLCFRVTLGNDGKCTNGFHISNTDELLFILEGDPQIELFKKLNKEYVKA